MVVHAAQHDSVAAVRRQPGLAAVRLDHRDIVEPAGAHGVAQALEACTVDLGGKNVTLRPNLRGESEGQSALARADIRHYRAALEAEDLLDARHLALGAEAEPAPLASRAGGGEHERKRRGTASVRPRFHAAHPARGR